MCWSGEHRQWLATGGLGRPLCGTEEPAAIWMLWAISPDGVAAGFTYSVIDQCSLPSIRFDPAGYRTSPSTFS